MDPILMPQVLSGVRRRIRYVRAGESLANAVTNAASGSTLVVAPGEYAGPVTIPATVRDIAIIGSGGRGSAAIAAATNGVALTNKADDVTLVNLGLEGDGTGGGLVNTGRRLRAVGCKIEGGAKACILAVGTDANIGDDLDSDGSDVLFDDCEFCWATDGVVVRASDYGAVTQARLRNCLFHNLSGKHVTEQLVAGATASVMFRDLEISSCVFRNAEDNSAPTNYIDLNGDNGNTGLVTQCAFPAAINSGLNLVSTAMLWVANYHPAGLSNGQPS